MIAWIGNIISIIKAVISLVTYLRQFIKDQEAKALEDKQAAEVKAVEDLKNAKTEQDVWDAQDKIVSDKP